MNYNISLIKKRRMKKLIFTLCLGAIAITGVAQNAPYKNPDLSPEQRAEDLLGR